MNAVRVCFHINYSNKSNWNVHVWISDAIRDGSCVMEEILVQIRKFALQRLLWVVRWKGSFSMEILTNAKSGCLQQNWTSFAQTIYITFCWCFRLFLCCLHQYGNITNTSMQSIKHKISYLAQSCYITLSCLQKKLAREVKWIHKILVVFLARYKLE